MPAPKIAFRKIDDLIPDPRNARTHSADQLATLVSSIRRFGWTNPVLADDMIRAGHGRVAAAALIYAAGDRLHMAPGKANGGALIPPGSVPVIDCTGWTDDERKAYALADNQIALQAGWDVGLLTAQLDELTGVDFDLPTIGFDTAALEALTAFGEGEEAARTRQQGEINDTDFHHTDQFAVIVKCQDEADQEAVFNALRATYGADNVKVVVV